MYDLLSDTMHATMYCFTRSLIQFITGMMPQCMQPLYCFIQHLIQCMIGWMTQYMQPLYCFIHPLIQCMIRWMTQCMQPCIVSFTPSYSVWFAEWHNACSHVLFHSFPHTVDDWLNDTIHATMHCVIQSLIQCMIVWMAQCMQPCIVSFSPSYSEWFAEWHNACNHALSPSVPHTVYDWLNDTMHATMYCYELANSNDNYLMQRNFTLAFGLKNYNFVEIGRQDTMLVWYPSMVTLFGHTFAELRICQCLPSKLNSDVNHIWMSIHGWMHLDFLDACILDFLHSWCPEFLNFLSCCLLVDVGWLLAQNQKWLLRRLVHPMTKSRIQEWQKKGI